MATYSAYRHVELDNIGCGKRRVLKPPGGGTSDLFTPVDVQDSPRKGSNHVMSGGPSPVTTNDSNQLTPVSSPNSYKPDGNPVTGEGYDIPKNGQAAAIIPNLVNGDATTPTAATPLQGRQRVPPGGFSSGLW